MVPHIVGIGELLWDVYPDGHRVAGGAPFNFAFHCHQLGHPATIISRVGNDKWGQQLRDRVRELGLSDEFIQSDPHHTTGSVQVSLTSDGQPSYTITENVAWDWITWTPELAERVVSAKAICFGTLAQRSRISAQTIRQAVKQANGLRVFDVNLRQQVDCLSLFETLRLVHWVKLNELEVQRLTQVCGRSFQRLMNDHVTCVGARATWIVTRGPHGCVIYPADGDPITEPGVAVQVADTVGAGDAFIAAMLCRYLEGNPLRECAQFANRYAARVCEQFGATPQIDRRAVEGELLDHGR
jgi:fructokinase